MTVHCGSEYIDHGHFYLFVIPSTVIAILSILLLIHTIHNECCRLDEIFRRVKTLRILYIILQILALAILTFNVLRLAVEPQYQFISSGHTSWCKWFAYLPHFIPAIYYAIYLMMILIRLEMSFKDTDFALSRRTVHILRISILILPVVVTGSLALDVTVPSCLNTWSAPDLAYDLSYCWLPVDEMILYKYHVMPAGVMWVCGLNIIFAALFTVKLLSLQKMGMTGASTKKTGGEQLKLTKFIVRNNVLTIIGCVSTIIGTATLCILFLCTLHTVCCVMIRLCRVYSNDEFPVYIYRRTDQLSRYRCDVPAQFQIF